MIVTRWLRNILFLGAAFTAVSPASAYMTSMDDARWNDGAAVSINTRLDQPLTKSASPRNGVSGAAPEVANHPEIHVPDPLILVFLTLGLLVFLVGIDRSEVRPACPPCKS